MATAGRSSPSLSLQSTASSTSSLSCPPPTDEFDELDSIPDFDGAAAVGPAAVGRSGIDSRTSELLKAKMAQFPDDMTVVELREIDDQTSTADDNTTDAETDDDDNNSKGSNTLSQPATAQQSAAAAAKQRQQQQQQLEASPSQSVDGNSGGPSAASSFSTARLSVSGPSSSVVSRLHNRLLRVSMGSAEQFPADIDDMPDDSNKSTQPQPATAGSVAASKLSVLGPTSSSTPAPLTPAASAPSARVLNEFALPDSLIQHFQQQQAAHVPCSQPLSAAQPESREQQLRQQQQQQSAVGEQQPVLSRELQLRFIIAQAEMAQHRITSHQTPRLHRPRQHEQQHEQQQQQHASPSRAVVRSSQPSSAASSAVSQQNEVARLRVPPAAPARKKDNWTVSNTTGS